MMRYSFKDFLKYQNELNEQFDKQKVNAIIDDMLIELRKQVECFPTLYAFIYKFYFNWDKKESYYLTQCSQAELTAIKSYFQDMGFKVVYDTDDTSIDGLKLTWGREP